MPILDRQFLESIGIDLDEESYQALDSHFETTLHQRVIDEIALEIEPEKAQELITTLKDADQAAVQQWLIENVTDLNEIISDEVDILLGELADSGEEIMSGESGDDSPTSDQDNDQASQANSIPDERPEGMASDELEQPRY